MNRRIKEEIALHIPISHLPSADKPRERLIKVGAENLSTTELLAILISSGTSRYSALDIAKALINKFGTLERMACASSIELQAIMGIGNARAVTLLAAFQLSRNMHREMAERKPVFFQNPGDVARVFIPQIGHLQQEVFVVALLDSSGKYVNSEVITRGTLDSSLVHPREVFKSAIRHTAAAIIVIHNHPSGHLMPSREDILVTNRLVEAGRLLEIPVHDHIIVTRADYVSLRKKGYL